MFCTLFDSGLWRIHGSDGRTHPWSQLSEGKRQWENQGTKKDVEDAAEEQSRWAWETKRGAKVTAQSLHSRQLKIHKYIYICFPCCSCQKDATQSQVKGEVAHAKRSHDEWDASAAFFFKWCSHLWKPEGLGPWSFVTPCGKGIFPVLLWCFESVALDKLSCYNRYRKKDQFLRCELFKIFELESYTSGIVK